SEGRRGRKEKASDRGTGWTLSDSSRSAIVRATRRARWRARTERQRRSTAAAAILFTGGSRQEKRSKAAGAMSAFRKPGRDGKRAAERSRAAVTRRRIVSEDSSGAGFWISAQETAGTETCRSMRSIRGPESLRAYLVRSAYPQVQTRRESPR